MNSLHLLSKQLDSLSLKQAIQERLSSPTTHQRPPSPRTSRPPSPTPRFLVFRLVLSLWDWAYTQWAVLVFMKKVVTGADLDLDDDAAPKNVLNSSHALGNIEEEALSASGLDALSSRSQAVSLWEKAGPLRTKIRQRASSKAPTSTTSYASSSSTHTHSRLQDTSNSFEISLNHEYPPLSSSPPPPTLDVADDRDDDGLSPSLQLTPPTPYTPSTALPLPQQTLLLNPSYSASFLTTNPKTSKRRKDPEAGTSFQSSASNDSSFYGTPPRTLTPTSLGSIARHRTPQYLPKTLVLDLDETLIHSTSRTPNASYGQGLFSAGGLGFGIGAGGGFGIWGGKKTGPGHMVEVVLGGRSTLYHVYKRPFVDYFLKKVSTWYTLVIFTASMQEYADPVIDWLDAGRGILAKRLFRESCTQLPNGSYSKDLALIEPDLARVALLDNSPVSYLTCQTNGIPIEGWTSDPSDEALLDLLPFLDSLRFTSDVRRVLGIRGF